MSNRPWPYNTNVTVRRQILGVRQEGAALIVSLVLLVAVTLLGVSAMQGTILQERMSGNQRDMEEAFNAAEIALRRGEQELLDDPLVWLSKSALDNPSNWAADNSGWDDFEEISEWPASVKASNYAKIPVYYIASRGIICESSDANSECDEIFSVTARGTGRNDNTFVVLESTYRLRQ
ncbi:MAG: PilX N-terminal domain-containing pilus assembly protein [Natronospirillum sp.]